VGCEHGAEDGVAHRRGLGDKAAAALRCAADYRDVPRRSRLDCGGDRADAPAPHQGRRAPSLDSDRHGRRPRPDGRQRKGPTAHVRDLREPPLLPGLCRAGGDSAPAGDRSGDADRLARRPHLHLPDPARLPLFSPVRRSGHGRDVPPHPRALALAEECVLGRSAAGVGHRRRRRVPCPQGRSHLGSSRARRRACDHARQTSG
jgi:hypothetical protein